VNAKVNAKANAKANTNRAVLVEIKKAEVEEPFIVIKGSVDKKTHDFLEEDLTQFILNTVSTGHNWPIPFNFQMKNDDNIFSNYLVQKAFKDKMKVELTKKFKKPMFINAIINHNMISITVQLFRWINNYENVDSARSGVDSNSDRNNKFKNTNGVNQDENPIFIVANEITRSLFSDDTIKKCSYGKIGTSTTSEYIIKHNQDVIMMNNKEISREHYFKPTVSGKPPIIFNIIELIKKVICTDKINLLVEVYRVENKENKENKETVFQVSLTRK